MATVPFEARFENGGPGTDDGTEYENNGPCSKISPLKMNIIVNLTPYKIDFFPPCQLLKYTSITESNVQARALLTSTETACKRTAHLVIRFKQR